MVVIANGWSPADVGAAAPLAGRLDAAVLYAAKGDLGQPTVDALKELEPGRVLLMGGPAALTSAVQSQVRRALPNATVERFSGADRIDTAARAALSAPAVARGRPVVLANGWSPPDVGAAAPLAASLGGSVLFAQRDSLGTPTENALRRLAPSQVIIVGGPAALSPAVRSEVVRVLPGVPVERLAGADRVDTAARGATRADVGLGEPVVLANGWSAADVGIAAPLAAALGGSVIFAQRDRLGDRAVRALSELSPSRVILIGGSARFAATLDGELERLLPGTPRVNIAAAGRIGTAALAALFGVQFSAEQTRFEEAVATIAPGEADCGDAPALRVRGITVVDPPANLNDPNVPLTVAEVVRIAGGCALVDYVALNGRSVAQIRGLLADRSDVFAVGVPLRGFEPDHGAGAHGGYGDTGSGRHFNDGAGEQWHLPAAYMEQLWEGWDPDNPVTVAVIDSGVDASHPDLENAVISSDSENGDLSGCHTGDSWDLSASNARQRPGGHGTHVAGIIAARRGNSGVVGVAPDSRIVPLNIWTQTRPTAGTDDDAGPRNCITADGTPVAGHGTSFSAPAAVAEAIMRGARVINMSFSSSYVAQQTHDDCDTPTGYNRRDHVAPDVLSRVEDLVGLLTPGCDAFAQLLAIAEGLPPDDDGTPRSVVAVAGAGNCGVECEAISEWDSEAAEWVTQNVADAYALPAAWDTVISVAAVDENGARANFSSARPDVEIAAPGVGILSTVPRARPGNNDFEPWSGTSMASPFVAGVVAHMLNRHPQATPEQVRLALAESAQDRGESGRDAEYGHGIVQPEKAITCLGLIVAGAPNCDPRLTTLNVLPPESAGTSAPYRLSPGFSLDTTVYSVSVPDGTSYVTIEARAADDSHRVEYSLPDLYPDRPGHQVRVSSSVGASSSGPVDKSATSAAVGERFLEVVGHAWNGAVIIASSENFPDGLAAASLAGTLRAPILLTPGDSLHPAVARFVRDNDVREIVIMGGPKAISDTVKRELEQAAGPNVLSSRLWGKDRYETAVEIAERVARETGGGELCGTNERAVFIATGRNSADALAASPAAYAARTPVLLVDPKAQSLNRSVTDFISDHRIDTAVILGGPSAIPEHIRSDLIVRGIRTTRISGADRYATAAGLATAVTSKCYDAVETISLANGQGFADALAAGPLTAELRGVLLLTGPGSVPNATIDAMTQVGQEAQLNHITLALLAIGDIAQADNAIAQANDTAGRAVRAVLNNPKQVMSVGDEHACAIRSDFTIACWGKNNHGQADAPPGKYTAIAADDDHTCAIALDGTIECWGVNHPGADQTIPPVGRFVDISADDSGNGGHNCAIRAGSGSIECWGWNRRGESDAPASGSYVAIGAGSFHGCAIRSLDRSITCWPGSNRGALDAPTGGGYLAIASGEHSSCAISADRSLLCWGSRTPVRSSTDKQYVAMDAGDGTVCVIAADASLECWGRGVGSGEPTGIGFVAVSTADSDACAIDTSGKAHCWGRNRSLFSPPSDTFWTPGLSAIGDLVTDTPPLTTDVDTISVSATTSSAETQLTLTVTGPESPTTTTTYQLTIHRP